MTDLKIPNLNMNSNKYIFKKKLSLRRKTNRRLVIESVFMFILGIFLVYVNYLIPNKNLLIQNIPINLNKSFRLIFELLSNVYEILLVVFITISIVLAFILLIGSFYRLYRIARRNTKIVSKK